MFYPPMQGIFRFFLVLGCINFIKVQSQEPNIHPLQGEEDYGFNYSPGVVPPPSDDERTDPLVIDFSIHPVAVNHGGVGDDNNVDESNADDNNGDTEGNDEGGNQNTRGEDASGEQQDEDAGNEEQQVPTGSEGELPIIEKRKRKRRGKGRGKKKSTEVVNLEQITIRKELAEDYPCKTVCWSISPEGVKYNGVVYGNAMCRDDRLHNATECKDDNYKSWADFVKWHKDDINDGKTLEEQEEQAIASLKKDPVVFQCVYCDKTYDLLSQLKQHVVGRKDGGRLVVDCTQRRVDELNGHHTTRLTQRPEKFPWAKLLEKYKQPTIIDTSSGQPIETFAVPANITEQIAQHMVDERDKDLGGKRGRKKKSPENPTSLPN